MNIFNKVKKTNEAIQKVETESEEIVPITYATMENAIKLIEVANEINSSFSLLLNLAIGVFKIDSDSFKGIKLLKSNKTQPDRVVISSADTLLTKETTIELQHIEKVIIDVKYEQKEGDDE